MDNEISTTIEMVQSGPHEYSTNVLQAYDFNNFADRLKFLYRQLAAPQSTVQHQNLLYLMAGCRMLGAEAGFIVSAPGSVYRSTTVYNARSSVLDDRLLDSEEQIYRVVNEHDKPCRGSHEAVRVGDGFAGSSHRPGQLQYFGTPLYVTGNKCGVLCFTTSKGFRSSQEDAETLELMAEGVARMIELQSTQEKNRIEDIRGFATGGVKSLDEYISQARLPEVYGVSGRVVEVLERRIGTMPLAIDYIASELNLSKRTLQRRLQQQNISFAQLRDQVRFHHSIDYLVHQTMSIDAISAALDFSDRTSFTNAFKRWTSLSPSTFRKLFRDYA